MKIATTKNYSPEHVISHRQENVSFVVGLYNSFVITTRLTCVFQRLYREKGEHIKHNYTLSGDLPEHVQAKLNAMNISEVSTLDTHTLLQR